MENIRTKNNTIFLFDLSNGFEYEIVVITIYKGIIRVSTQTIYSEDNRVLLDLKYGHNKMLKYLIMIILITIIIILSTIGFIVFKLHLKRKKFVNIPDNNFTPNLLALETIASDSDEDEEKQSFTDIFIDRTLLNLSKELGRGQFQ